MSDRNRKHPEDPEHVRQWLNIAFPDDAFNTPEGAWATAADTRDTLLRTVLHLDGVRGLDGDLPSFVMAAVSRGLGLHDAVMREGHVSNRHAVWPLLRSLLDTVLVTLEVRRNPAYAGVVIRPTESWEPHHRRLRSQALIGRSKIEGPSIPSMWKYLSEAAHFGWLAYAQSVVKEERLSDTMISVDLTTNPEWVEVEDEISAAWHLARLTEGLGQTVQKIVGDHPAALGGKPLVSDAE